MRTMKIYHRNGAKLEPAYKLPRKWAAKWSKTTQPFDMDLPDLTTDAPAQTVTLELLWPNGAPHIVVTRGAQYLEAHPMVEKVKEETNG